MKLVLSKAVSKPCSACGYNYKKMIELDDKVRICKRCFKNGLARGEIKYDKSNEKPLVGDYFSIYVTGSRSNVRLFSENSGLFDDRIKVKLDPMSSKVGSHVLKIDIPYDLSNSDNVGILILYVSIMKDLGMECMDYKLPISFTFGVDEKERSIYLSNLSVFYERYFKDINRLCSHSVRDTNFILSDAEVTKICMSKNKDIYSYILSKKTESEDNSFYSVKSPINADDNSITIKMKRGNLRAREFLTLLDIFKSIVSINKADGNIRSNGNICKLFDTCSHIMNLDTARRLINNGIDTQGYSIQRYDRTDFSKMCDSSAFTKQIISKKKGKSSIYEEMLKSVRRQVDTSASAEGSDSDRMFRYINTSAEGNSRDGLRFVEPASSDDPTRRGVANIGGVDWDRVVRTSSDNLSGAIDRDDNSVNEESSPIRAVPNFFADDEVF